MTNTYSPVVDSAAANGGHSHPDDMPRERLARRGVRGLRDDELLAVVLGTGYRGHGVLEVARQILEVHPKEELVTMKLEVLRRLQGVESVKAALLVAAFTLARRGLLKGLGVQPIISARRMHCPCWPRFATSARSIFSACASMRATR